MHRIVCRVSFATGWTREYVLDHLSFAQLIRYFEYGEERIADIAQVTAYEIGLILGFIQLKEDTGSTTGCADVGEDGGISDLILANIGNGVKHGC